MKLILFLIGAVVVLAILDDGWKNAVKWLLIIAALIFILLGPFALSGLAWEGIALDAKTETPVVIDRQQVELGQVIGIQLPQEFPDGTCFRTGGVLTVHEFGRHTFISIITDFHSDK